MKTFLDKALENFAFIHAKDLFWLNLSARFLCNFVYTFWHWKTPVKLCPYICSSTSGSSHKLLTKLRLNFSALNEHKFRHNFECLDPICACGTGKEDNKHFLLHFPLFELQRRDLLGQLGDLPGIDIVSLDSETICELHLFGSPNLNVIVNRIILEATISFIKSTQRLG